MNMFHKFAFATALALVATSTFSCSSDDGNSGNTGSSVDDSSSSAEIKSSSSRAVSEFVSMDDITLDNYPRVDGSTSTDPLNLIIAAKLLGYEYQWHFDMNSWLVSFEKSFELRYNLNKIKCSQTHGAIVKLIDNETDIITVARKMSPDEKQYAESKGVELIETPIALDALDFMLNPHNLVSSLTDEQIRNIYLREITNWSEAGGANEAIKPFIRNANSGSQEMMNEIVMNGEEMADWDVSNWDDETIHTMMAVFEELQSNQNGICFTPHYYKEYIIRDGSSGNYTKTIDINGITPSAETIENGTYPFIAEVYVSIRSDLDTNSMAYKMYEWLQTAAGKAVIAESGYVAN